MRFNTVVAVVLFFLGLNLSARADYPDLGPLMPDDNSDLQQIIDNAQAIELFSAGCGSEFECVCTRQRPLTQRMRLRR